MRPPAWMTTVLAVHLTWTPYLPSLGLNLHTHQVGTTSSTLQGCCKNGEIIWSRCLTSALFLNRLLSSPLVFRCPPQLRFVLRLSSHSFFWRVSCFSKQPWVDRGSSPYCRPQHEGLQVDILEKQREGVRGVSSLASKEGSMKRPSYLINGNSHIHTSKMGLQATSRPCLNQVVCFCFRSWKFFPHLKHKDDCPDHPLLSNVLWISSIWSS